MEKPAYRLCYLKTKTIKKTNKYQYIEDFKRLGFGLFCHFGLYSVVGKGEWYLDGVRFEGQDEYNALMEKFEIAEDWAKELVATAKAAGCKYITLTTRHHDGFSLFDTCGLNTFDAPHSACGRDLVREFVDECNKEGIVPFFYHTLLDWWKPEFKEDFPAYIDYLVDSVEVLCKNYGKIGGLWFDGMWAKPEENWQEDRLYATIRKYQPEAMIINNTGLNALGKTGHPEIDSVTFERGAPTKVNSDNKPIAGEVCQGITDHWGYAEDDICVKPVAELVELLVDCRKYQHNLLLNVGPMADGKLTEIESGTLKYMGKWVARNEAVVYNCVPADIQAENADIVTDGKYYYALIKKVPMSANAHVARVEDNLRVTLKTDKRIVSAVWLDNNAPVSAFDECGFYAEPFMYGTSLGVRVAKLELE